MGARDPAFQTLTAPRFPTRQENIPPTAPTARLQTGYSAGKAAAVFEILNAGADHLKDCGCTPCGVRRTLQLDRGPEIPRITPESLEAPAIAAIGTKTTS